MNIRVHVSFRISLLVFWINTQEWNMVLFVFCFIFAFFVFLGISIPFFTVAAPIYIPANSVQGFLFFTSTPTCVICSLFDESHSDRCEVISHCGFNLHFSNDSWCWASFHVLVGHLHVLFEKMSIHVFCPFFNWVACFLGFELYELFIYFGY